MTSAIPRDFFDDEYRQLWSAVVTEERTRWELRGLGEILEACPPPASILDVGGGDGRLARPLGLAGYDVTVVDASGSMLRHGLVQSAADAVSWLQGDGRDLPLTDESVDCVLNVFTSFGYFETDEEHQQMIGEMARVLRPGGLLIMDLMHRDWAAHAGPSRSWIEAPGGGDVLREFRFDPIAGRSHETARLAGSKGLPRRWSLRIFSATELNRMFGRVGLVPQAWYSDFELNPFEAAGPRLLVVATKGKAPAPETVEGRSGEKEQVGLRMVDDMDQGGNSDQSGNSDQGGWRKILSRLACPQTGRPLSVCTDKELDTLNEAIGDGQVSMVNGQAFDDRLEAGLIRDDGLRVYPIRDGIPVLFVEEALAVDDLSLR